MVDVTGGDGARDLTVELRRAGIGRRPGLRSAGGYKSQIEAGRPVAGARYWSPSGPTATRPDRPTPATCGSGRQVDPVAGAASTDRLDSDPLRQGTLVTSDPSGAAPDRPPRPPTAPMRTDYCGELRADDVGRRGGGVRLGGPPPRARRAPGLHRRARPHRDRAVRGRRRPRPAQRVRRAGHRHGAPAPGGHGQPRPAHRRDRDRSVRRSRSSARPSRRRSRSTSAWRSTRRFACGTATSTCARERMQRNLRVRATVNSALRRAMEAPGLHRGRDPDAHRLDPRGRPRLRGAVAAEPGQLLRPAPEPAAVQAALHGGRGRPLLPDRPLPARRGPAGRPPVRVHAARRRGQLRRARPRCWPSSPRRWPRPPRR